MSEKEGKFKNTHLTSGYCDEPWNTWGIIIERHGNVSGVRAIRGKEERRYQRKLVSIEMGVNPGTYTAELGERLLQGQSSGN